MLRNYIKMALKVLARRKFFTFISLFGISLTLLVLMVASAMLDHLFAPHSPESRLDRTVGIHSLAMAGESGRRSGQPGYGYIDRHLRNIEGVERMTIFEQIRPVTSFVRGSKVNSFLKRTDGEFWKIYDFRFLEGDPYTNEDEANANFVAVINEATRNRFFEDQPALGRSLELDGQKFRVVGVVDNVPITRILPFADVWVPLSTAKSDAYKTSDWGSFGAVFLAQDRSAFPRIRQEAHDRIVNSRPEGSEKFPEVRGGLDTLFEAFSRVVFGGFAERNSERLVIFLIIAGLLFTLLPTVNLVNINLSRIMERSSEIGVRKAFGASSRTLVGQFVVENVILTLLGGLLGLVLSAIALGAINASQVIPYSDFQLNLRIFAYGFGLALLFGILSGVYPAWRMSRMNPVTALQGRSK